MRIALLHTADVHVATFDRIFADMAVNVQLDHHVDAGLLARARADGPEAVRTDVQSKLKELASADAVLCTCSTLGPLVDEAAQSLTNVLRIDRPLMAQACADGPHILVALCLESTRAATLALLHECADEGGHQISPVIAMCSDAWAFFEAGDMAAYAASIASTVQSELAAHPHIDCVVLAQASMRVAEARLTSLGIPVRSAPVIAAQRCIAVAQQHVTSRTGA